MATCSAVAAFLDQLKAKTVTTPLAAPDLARLQSAGWISVMSNADVAQLGQDTARLGAVGEKLAADQVRERDLRGQLAEEGQKTTSILFHFEGAARRAGALEKEQADRSSLTGLDAELGQETAEYNRLLGLTALQQSLVPVGGQYLGLTSLGTLALRDLEVRQYRVSDLDFDAYWAQTQATYQELARIALAASRVHGGLAPSLGGVDRSYLWAIAVGLAKLPIPPETSVPAFLAAFQAFSALTSNVENRLMAAELVSATGRPVAASLTALKELEKAARSDGVDKASALGVAAILLDGQRADGTFATDALSSYLAITKSYETAALLAVVNRPSAELTARFNALRTMFAQWGYRPSEDLELASAFLAVSDLPLESASPKLAVLAKGLGAYLGYPLVAAAILASIPVLEAHETLNLVETTYQYLARYTGPLPEGELICLAVRAVHGVAVASVSALDPTAAARAPPVAFTYGAGRLYFVPVFIVHGAYYSTFSGIGGAHPGHVHGFAGGFGG